MIQVDKGLIIPKILLTGRGKKETDKLCTDFDKDPASFQALGEKEKPSKSHAFNAKIYSSKLVKNELIKLQHNKCCFSEAKLNGDYGDVEHFRPKGRLGEGSSNIKSYPGYYWLAYSWGNLLLCKQMINQSYKKDFFPLINNDDRACNHNEDLALERPVLIDPSQEDPRDHIRFHRDEPVGITDRGKKTIILLNLRHSHFVEARRSLFKKLNSLKDAMDELDRINPNCPIAEKIREELGSAICPEAEFSSMAIDLLQNE